MNQPQVILSGFADEGPVSKRAEEQLTMLRALGMGYYTVRFVDVGYGVKNAMKLTDTEVARLVQLHDEFEIKVSSLGSPLGKIKLVDEEDGTHNVYVPFDFYMRNNVAHAIQLAQALGTKLIRGFSFYPPKDADPLDYLEQAADYLGQIAEACERADVYFGLEVEANLVGRDGPLQRALWEKIDSARVGAGQHLRLIFDGANISCQGYTTADVIASYFAMKPAIGWMHIKDYKHPRDTGGKQQVGSKGYVDESAVHNMVPCDMGDSGHEVILRDFKSMLPALSAIWQERGVPGVFLDLEPHLKGGGQFGGFSGPDGFGVALRALTNVLDYVGIGYDLTRLENLTKLQMQQT